MQTAASRSVMVGVVMVGVLAVTTTAHMMGLGSCRSFDGMENFDPVRFNGTWYVIKKIGTSSDCLTVTYNLQEDDQSFRVEEIRRPPYSNTLPLDLIVTNVGTMTPESVNSEYIASWENSFLPDIQTSYKVMATDYDTYAVDYECHQILFINRVSATILSRTPQMDQAKIDELTQKLVSNYSVTDTRLNWVDQDSCTDLDATDFNLVIDEQGISNAIEEMDRLSKLSQTEAAQEIALLP